MTIIYENDSVVLAGCGILVNFRPINHCAHSYRDTKLLMAEPVTENKSNH